MAGEGGGEVAAVDLPSVGLRYVTDDRPGITRRRAGKSFAFYAPDGRKIVDRELIRWIKSLAIPPA